MKITLNNKEIELTQEEVNEIVKQSQEKKEEKIIGIAIKNRFTGSIIFQSTKTTYKEAIIEKGDANLSDADLSGADLRGAELQNAKFYGRGGTIVIKKANLEGFLGALGFKLEE